MILKRCTKCGIEKSIEEFYRWNGRTKDGHHHWCKECANKANRRRHRERFNKDPMYRVRDQLKFKYGMSLEDYERMSAQQDGRCAICGSLESHGKTQHFVVDHDHTTGEIRALLCNRCNPALGLMGDDPERLEAAARYLRAFKRE